MTSLFRGVVNWLEGSTESDPENVDRVTGDAMSPYTEAADVTEGSHAELTEGTTNAGACPERNSRLAMEEDLMEVSMKAMHTAKEWGGYLLSIGKVTTGQVTKTAKFLKSAFELKTYEDESSYEDTELSLGSDQQTKPTEVAVAPWVGYNEADTMKTQILALSKDRQNFVRGPPAGVEFFFDYNVSYPVALVMLEEDPDLKAMRFELVPKQVREETFWQNYFYRVSLIKQSAQLTALAKCSVVSPVSDRENQTTTTGVNSASGICNVEMVANSQHFDTGPQEHVVNYADPPDDWDQELDIDDYEFVSEADIDVPDRSGL